LRGPFWSAKRSGIVFNFEIADMQDNEAPFKPGERIRLSALGKERCPKLNRTGVVIGPAGRSDAIRVLIDGRKTPMTLHASYVEIFVR
jgi:hypothetical protein